MCDKYILLIFFILYFEFIQKESRYLYPNMSEKRQLNLMKIQMIKILNGKNKKMP